MKEPALGEFIKVEIDLARCQGMTESDEWIDVCPVNIFKLENNRPVVVEENEDECTLCMLCVNACKSGTITIHKLYDQ